MELRQLRKENEDLRGQLEEKDGAVLENLKTLPHDEAVVLFHRLRATTLGTSAVCLRPDHLPPRPTQHLPPVPPSYLPYSRPEGTPEGN